MANTILTNNGATFIGASMSKSRDKVITAQSQLASGLKNPDPATNPSATAVSMGVIGQVGVSEVVLDVVTQAASILQLAVGVIQSDIEILNRMQDLSVRSSSATIDDSNRLQLDAEYKQLLAQIDLNASTTWGNQNLFDGTYINQNYQIGLKSSQVLTVNLGDLQASFTSMGLNGTKIDTAADASTTLTSIENALSYVLDQLAQVASYRSRLDAVGDTMTIMNQNLRSVLSTYRDADVALSLTEAQRQNTLVDAASAALQNNNTMFSKLGRLIQSSLNS
jgi:flagellin